MTVEELHVDIFKGILLICHRKFEIAKTFFCDGRIQKYPTIEPQSTQLNHQKHQSGLYIIEGILDIIDGIHEAKPTRTIHIEWVSAYKTTEGNERVDQAAKRTAISNTAPPFIRMKSTQNRSISIHDKYQTGNWIEKRYPGTTTGSKLYGALQQRETSMDRTTTTCTVLISLRPPNANATRKRKQWITSRKRGVLG